MRVLLAFWDGGEGHLARVAYLAGLLDARGHPCMILTSPAKSKRVRQLAPTARIGELANRPPRPAPDRPVTPAYSHAFRHAQRRLALGFDEEFVAANAVEAGNAIRVFRPDVVVNDYHDTVRIAADLAGIPVVSLAMAHGLRSGSTLGAWKEDELCGRPVPECLDCFNQVRARYGLAPYADERETFEGVVNLVASCPELDPLCQRDSDVYVGPVMTAPAAGQRSWRRPPLVVSYLAEGNNRPESAYPEALARLVAVTFDIEFVVLGGPRYVHWFQPGDTFRKMVTPDEYLALLGRADVVVTHGGTTLVHALERSVPVLCLPWTSSEAAWAVHAEAFGAGLLYPAYRSRLEWRIDPAVDPAISVAGHWSLPITAAGLDESLRRILDDASFRRSAAALGDRLRAARTTVDIVSLIEGVACG